MLGSRSRSRGEGARVQGCRCKGRGKGKGKRSGDESVDFTPISSSAPLHLCTSAPPPRRPPAPLVSSLLFLITRVSD